MTRGEGLSSGVPVRADPAGGKDSPSGISLGEPLHRPALWERIDGSNCLLTGQVLDRGKQRPLDSHSSSKLSTRLTLIYQAGLNRQEQTSSEQRPLERRQAVKALRGGVA